MPDLEAIRKRYRSMVNIRNNSGAPSVQECDLRDLLEMVNGGIPEPVTNPSDRIKAIVKELDGCHVCTDAVREFNEEAAARVLQRAIGRAEAVVGAARAMRSGMQHAHMALRDALDDLDGKPRMQESD